VGIRRILLKNWEGIRVLGKVEGIRVFFDFLKMFEYTFSNTYEYFGILDTLEYTLVYFGILCGIPI